jgi:hypothetical protein
MVRWRAERRWLWVDAIAAGALVIAIGALLLDTWHVLHADDGLVATTARITVADQQHTAGTIVTGDRHAVVIAIPRMSPVPDLGAKVDVVFPEGDPDAARRANPRPWLPLAAAAGAAVVVWYLVVRVVFLRRYLQLVDAGPAGGFEIAAMGRFKQERSVLDLWDQGANPDRDRPIGLVSADFVAVDLTSGEVHPLTCTGRLRRGGVIALWRDDEPIVVQGTVQRWHRH